MNLKKSSIILGSLLAGSLAIASPKNLYAQNPDRNRCPKPTSGMLVPPWGQWIPADTAKSCHETSAQHSDRLQRQNPANNSIYSITLNAGELSYGLTAAGGGIFARPEVIPVVISPEETMSIDVNLRNRRDRNYFRVRDAKSEIEREIRSLGPDNSLTGEQKAYKYNLARIASRLGHNDAGSVRALEQVLSDGEISGNEVRHLQELNVKDGVYAIIVEDRRYNPRRRGYTTVGSTPILVNLDIVPAEQRTAQQAQALARPESSVAVIHQQPEVAHPQHVQPPVVAQQPAQTPAQNYEFVPPAQKERRNIEFGLEAGYGTNNEATIGAFANARIAPMVRIEGYGNYSFVRGNPKNMVPVSDTSQTTNELIGPGTYKSRTDIITTTGSEKPLYEFGGRFVLEPSNWLDLFAGAGAKTSTGNQYENGEATIGYQRNGVPLNSVQVVTNNLVNRTSSSELSLEAGARFNLNRHFSIGLSYNKTGNQKNEGINFRYTF